MSFRNVGTSYMTLQCIIPYCSLLFPVASHPSVTWSLRQVYKSISCSTSGPYTAGYGECPLLGHNANRRFEGVSARGLCFPPNFKYIFCSVSSSTLKTETCSSSETSGDLNYSSNFNMETCSSSETSGDFQRTMLLYIWTYSTSEIRRAGDAVGRIGRFVHGVA
jgi:hypothetical protein